MRVGLDGLPLTSPKTGVGHYTFELASALPRAAPASSFEIIYPSSYPAINFIENGKGVALPDNLRLERVQVGLLGRPWWSVGLPRYVRRHNVALFHGTNYDVPLWRPCATVLTIHDLSQFLHPETHERRSVNRAHRRLPVMARAADAMSTAAVRRSLGVGDNFLLAVGTLEPRKNLSVLVSAFEEMTRARSEKSTQLVI